MNDMKTIDIDWAWLPFEPSADNPWDHKLAAHLFRRAGFGADRPALDDATGRSPAEVVDGLIALDDETPEFRSVADALMQTVVAGGDPKRLSAAWVYRLLFTPNQLLEKMTLFWHGHFATGAEKVTNASLNWQQNQLFRQHALGDFTKLANGISQDPAMLIYLDSIVNRKAHPNENFARELMELFCLGEGNYRERDVQELARCFTGWEIKNNRFRKNRYQQDTGDKTVLGQSGRFDGEDGIRIVLEQPHLESFLARKWFRFFVADEPQPSDELLQPLADCFREHDLQIAPALKMLLRSNLFFSEHAIGRKIKSPVELMAGMLRSLGATANTQVIAQGLLTIGQGLFYPPNVKGWDGGRAWINSSTLLGRSNLVADILKNDATLFDKQNLTDYLAGFDVHSSEQALAHFEMCMLPTRLNDATRSQMCETFASNQDNREQSLRSLLHAFISLPQSQLG